MHSPFWGLNNTTMLQNSYKITLQGKKKLNTKCFFHRKQKTTNTKKQYFYFQLNISNHKLNCPTIQKVVKVTLPFHVINFLSTQNSLTIRMESLDHCTKGEGIFSPDTIAQTSDNFFQKTHDVIQSIQFIKDQSQNFQLLGNILKINFKYMMNKKEKMKINKFPLTIQSNDDATIFKLQNLQLKNKINELEKQILSLKQNYQHCSQTLNEISQKYMWKEQSLELKEQFDLKFDYRVLLKNKELLYPVIFKTSSLHFCDFAKNESGHMLMQSNNRKQFKKGQQYWQKLNFEKLFKRKNVLFVRILRFIIF